jgi:hypothetical protein
VRLCGWCDNELVRRPLEQLNEFEKRRFCSKSCAQTARHRSPLKESQTAQERLSLVGMAPRPRPGLMYLTCLLCGRGTGPDGQTVWLQEPPEPSTVGPCRVCGGKLWLEEVSTFRVPAVGGPLGNGRHLTEVA